MKKLIILLVILIAGCTIVPMDTPKILMTMFVVMVQIVGVNVFQLENIG